MRKTDHKEKQPQLPSAQEPNFVPNLYINMSSEREKSKQIQTVFSTNKITTSYWTLKNLVYKKNSDNYEADIDD